MQIVVLLNILDKSLFVNIFLLCQFGNGTQTSLCNIFRQAAFQVHRSVCLAAGETLMVVIHILADEVIYDACLITHHGVFYHRVNDMLTLFSIVLTVRIEVGYQFEDICHIDDIAVKQFKAKVYVGDFSLLVFCNHAWRIFCPLLRFIILI